MIITQGPLKKILLLNALIYTAMYLAIYKSFKIENLYIVKYVVIGVFVVSLIVSCICLFRQMKIGVFCYCLIGMALILFFISSIFIFKVEDLFFWDIQKYKNREFFDFSFFLLGCNYVAAIPYLLLILGEIAFIRFPPTGASMPR